MTNRLVNLISEAKQVNSVKKCRNVSKQYNVKNRGINNCLNSSDIMNLCDCKQTKACEVMRIIRAKYNSATPLKNQIRKADFLEFYKVNEQDFN